MSDQQSRDGFPATVSAPTLVERLRIIGTTPCVFDSDDLIRAADEIERLRMAIGAQCDHMEARAARFAGPVLCNNIFNGAIIAEELRRHAERYRGALAPQEDIEHVG